MTIFLSIFSLVCLFFLLFSIRLNLKLQEKIEKINESLDACLDVLDFSYKRIVEKSQIEVLSDEPIVRELVEDIRQSKNAIIAAGKLISGELYGEEQNDREKED